MYSSRSEHSNIANPFKSEAVPALHLSQQFCRQNHWTYTQRNKSQDVDFLYSSSLSFPNTDATGTFGFFVALPDELCSLKKIK